MSKASDFKVGDVVRDIRFEDSVGEVVEVTVNTVDVVFTGPDETGTPFSFMENIDLEYLEKVNA